jgi:signal peptidase I
VVDDSMRPSLEPGDRLLLSYRRAPRPGDVVVARLPGGVVAVKRAAERRTTEGGEPGWWLLSDNADRGSDSRRYGAVADADIVAVVVMRIWPRGGGARPRGRLTAAIRARWLRWRR